MVSLGTNHSEIIYKIGFHAGHIWVTPHTFRQILVLLFKFQYTECVYVLLMFYVLIKI